jgi:hypothetical protein
MFDEYKNKSIVIYAAGNDGQSLYRVLKSNDIIPDFFIDIHADRIKEVEGIAVYSPTSIPQKMDFNSCIVFIALSNARFYSDAVQTLRLLGFTDIRNGIHCIIELNQATCVRRLEEDDSAIHAEDCLTCQAQFYKCPIYGKFVRKCKPVLPHDIVVPYVALIITTRCVNRCKDCHASIPYLKLLDFNTNALLSDMETLLNYVKYIYQLGIGSGEVFLFKDLPKLLDHLLREDRIGSIHITTTGAVMPDDRLLKMMDHPKICISISDYGDALSETITKRRAEFIEALTKRNKPFRYNQSLTWYDLGDHSNRHRMDDEDKAIFKSCEFHKNGNVIFNGKLYHCTRTYTHDILGLIPTLEEDFMNLRNKDNLIPRLLNFYKTEIITTCSHCNGTTDCPEIPAGIQLSKA